jgi:hypothetical protein
MAEEHIIPEPIRKHPYLTAGVVAGGGLLLFLIFNAQVANNASSAGTGSVGVSAADALAYQNSQNQLAAALSAQTGQENYNLAAEQESFQGQLALAQEGDQTQLAETNTAASVASAQNQEQFQLGESGISAELAGLESNNQTSLGLATIAANENTGIAQINANVENQISNNETQLGIIQANDSANVQITGIQTYGSVEKAQIGASETTGILGFLAAVF